MNLIGKMFVVKYYCRVFKNWDEDDMIILNDDDIVLIVSKSIEVKTGAHFYFILTKYGLAVSTDDSVNTKINSKLWDELK